MTCRIDRLMTEGDVVLMSISGRLTAQDAETLRTFVEREPGVAFDLRDLLFVDRAAIGLLAVIEASGAELRNCPPYIREWVAQERRRMERADGDV
jgi:anti-anti-sigma regulatory factor